MTDNAPERFDPTTNGSGAVWMEPDEWGEYVSYSDYTALVAERDRAVEWRDHDRERALAAEARANKAEAAITAALELLDASLFTNAEHQQAKDILRGALQEKPDD